MSEIAVFGSGCFWCSEAVFKEIRGVLSVEPGYSGGELLNPSYEQVCSGQTGHAEVVHVEFDPTLVTYQELLEVFFSIHDPTSLNRQGNDVGTQYRSIILTTTPEQQKIAQATLLSLSESGAYPKPLVTQIEPLTTFFPAEEYHRDYFAKNPLQGYCMMVVKPKVDKFKKAFKPLIE